MFKFRFLIVNQVVVIFLIFYFKIIYIKLAIFLHNWVLIKVGVWLTVYKNYKTRICPLPVYTNIELSYFLEFINWILPIQFFVFIFRQFDNNENFIIIRLCRNFQFFKRLYFHRISTKVYTKIHRIKQNQYLLHHKICDFTN